ncbi:MAG: bifunctional 4-hydroxy-2-oxoglutarate aldolase/2-dehydro-3-deoxy-phosphogluconate aldolase [Faecousia sp.]
MKASILEATRKHRVTAILRGIDPERLQPVVEALFAGGIRLLEVTFNQKSPSRLEDTAGAIRWAKETYGEELYVGAGTVMHVEEVLAARQAGAEFILAPNVDETVIRAAVEQGMCAIPGAMTPTEIARAYDAGAEIVKLFPAGNLGLGYCKAVMAPLNHIPMIAVGGVDQHNLPSFLKAGFLGAGIGSSLTDRTLIQAGDYAGLKALAEEFVAAARV